MCRPCAPIFPQRAVHARHVLGLQPHRHLRRDRPFCCRRSGRWAPRLAQRPHHPDVRDRAPRPRPHHPTPPGHVRASPPVSPLPHALTRVPRSRSSRRGSLRQPVVPSGAQHRLHASAPAAVSRRSASAPPPGSSSAGDRGTGRPGQAAARPALAPASASTPRAGRGLARLVHASRARCPLESSAD